MKHLLAREEIARVLRAKLERLPIGQTEKAKQMRLMVDWTKAHSDEQIIEMALDWDLTDVLVYEHEVMDAESFQ
jgi:ribosomal protein L18